jgi:GT2 family glycosyltransferase
MVGSAHVTPTPPEVSILVCTRNRRDNVVPTVRSIQECGYSSFELLILDQSDDESTKESLAKICADDPRVRHLHLPRPGKPEALNEGLRQARGPYVLLTDDDCEARVGWIEAMVGALREDSRVGCVYGSVEAAPHDAGQGYIPAREITEAHSISSLGEFLTMPGWENYGMGANMAFRSEALRTLGGWDVCVGPGAKFGSGDDNDVAVRVLRAGYRIAFCPSARVVHYGFRLWKSNRRDLSRRGFGLGAVVAKHMRCGVVFSGGLRAARYEAKQCVTRMSRGERPRGVTFLAGWVRGFWAGLRHPIDRRTGLFVPDEVRGGEYREQVADVVLRAEMKDQPDR